jgi:hypothetical protein
VIAPFAIWYPGLLAKTNVGARRSKGAVLHSAEGSLNGAFGRLRDPNAQVSWHFTVALDGTIYQHYDSSIQCWHAHAAGNVNYVGIEHENAYTLGHPNHDPETDAQLNADVQILEWLSSGENWDGYQRREELWEHNEIPGNWTDCPSGRIRWGDIAVIVAPVPVTPDGIGVVLDGYEDLGPVYVPPPGRTIIGIGIHKTDGSTEGLWPHTDVQRYSEVRSLIPGY